MYVIMHEDGTMFGVARNGSGSGAPCLYSTLNGAKQALQRRTQINVGIPRTSKDGWKIVPVRLVIED